MAEADKPAPGVSPCEPTKATKDDGRPSPRRSTKAFATGWLLLASAFAHLSLAPARLLSFDEAYYLVSATRQPAFWPIADHPPLLALLLAAVDRLPVPVELRVRLVPVLLSIGLSLGVIRLARQFANSKQDSRNETREDSSEHPSITPEHATSHGAIANDPGRDTFWLFSTSLFGHAIALFATPDAPLAMSLVWVLSLSLPSPEGMPALAEPCIERHRSRGTFSRRRLASLSLLAGLSLLAKVNALTFLTPLALWLWARRETKAAGAIAVGCLVSGPFCIPSLSLQLAHAAGRGTAVSAPYIGPISACIAFVAGQAMLLSPGVVWISIRQIHMFTRRSPMRSGLRDLALWGSERYLTLMLLGGVYGPLVLSALVTGRPPEPNWSVPCAGLVMGLAGAGLGRASRRARRWVFGLSLVTGTLFVAGWVAPLGRPPFDKCPPRAFRAQEPPETWPPYARGAWREIYP